MLRLPGRSQGLGYAVSRIFRMSSTATLEYDQKSMPFRRLGPSGLRVPLFSLGGWLTFGKHVVGDPAKAIIRTAFENGISMFDNAESYGNPPGKSEAEMGRVIKELALRRSDLVITTKLHFGTRRGPNNNGLSRKHIIEGVQESLGRLQMDYVDIIFAHRPDSSVPMEEIVRAFNYVIDKGWAFYWGTSEWSAREIEEAFHVADKLNLAGPVAEQCQHNMFHRARPEREYASLYKKYGIGTTVWSPLASGILTGKYNNTIPPGSRLDVESEFFSDTLRKLYSPEGRERIRKVKELGTVAEDLGTTTAALALAWVAKHPDTSTVILGATRPEQIVDNLKAIEVLPKLTSQVMGKIEDILMNKPGSEALYGRPVLDEFGRKE